MKVYEEGGCVDAETKLALKEMKEEIINAVQNIVSDRNRELEKYITELNDSRFKAIEKELDRHSKQHEEHYAEIKNVKDQHSEDVKEIDNKITASRQSIIDEIKSNSRFNSSTVIALFSMLGTVAAVIVAIAAIRGG